VIGVALFQRTAARAGRAGAGQPSSSRSEREADAPAPESPAAAANPCLADQQRRRHRSVRLRLKAGPEGGRSTAPLPAPKLGTGHGARETSVVSHTSFARLQSQPNEVIRIRYDSRENLIAAGVIREPVARGPIPDPFPQSGDTPYVPDPPLRRY
jgi:hypothetical protein